MNIFLLTKHTVVNGEEITNEHRAFNDKSNAQQALKEWVDDEINYINEDEWFVSKNTSDEFEAYEVGYYSTNHSIGYIEIIEVE